MLIVMLQLNESIVSYRSPRRVAKALLHSVSALRGQELISVSHWHIHVKTLQRVFWGSGAGFTRTAGLLRFGARRFPRLTCWTQRATSHIRTLQCSFFTFRWNREKNRRPSGGDFVLQITKFSALRAAKKRENDLKHHT